MFQVLTLHQRDRLQMTSKYDMNEKVIYKVQLT